MAGALSDSSVLVTTSIVHLTNDACFSLLYPLLPFIAADLGLSYTETGMLKATFSGASSVLQVPAGIVGARYGEMLVLLLGNLWVGVGLVGMALTGSFMLLLGAALLTGIGGNAQHPLGSSIVSNHVRREQLATSMGTLNFSGDLGKLIGPFVAGIVAVQFGWRAAFAVVGIATAVYTLWVLLRQRRENRSGSRSASRSVEDDGTPIRRGFSFVLLAGGLDNATRGAALTFLPFVLVEKGLDAAAISLLFGVIFAAGAAGKFACGWLSDRRGILAVIVVTEAVTAGTLLALAFAPLWAVIPLVLVFGFALNGTSSALAVAVTQFVPAAKRARGFGIYFTAALISSAAAPLLYGVLADATSITTTFVTMTILTLAVLPAILPIRTALAAGNAG
jgi:MFS family permease